MEKTSCEAAKVSAELLLETHLDQGATKLKFLQINLHHSKAATSVHRKKFTKETST